MNTYKIYKVIDHERRMRFDKKIIMAKKLGISKQNLDNYMNVLKNNNPRHPFNNLCRILDALGYEIIVRKK